MAEYLSVIVTLSLFSAIINAFLSDKGASKTVKSVISLILVTATIIPIVKNLALFKDNYSLPVINEKIQIT